MAACDGSDSTAATRWLLDPTAPLPAELSGLGFLEDMATRTPYPDVAAYVPKHILFSNGLDKERHLYLPDGTGIDGSAADAWDFPIGTVLAKTFVYEGSPVETRLLFRTNEAWDYALYQWRADGLDAQLLEENWAEVPVELGDGALTHMLPSRLDCRTCHETHEAVAGAPVIGVSSLQTDEDLAQAGVFSGVPVLEDVAGRNAEETAALSYFLGNCTTCHNGGDAINSSFSLYPDDAVANTVGQPTETETGEGVRVVPGEPEKSVLLTTVIEAPTPEYRGPFKAMPPIGLSVIDPDAASVLSSWIESL